MIFFILAQLVYWICQILIFILVARAILSWIVFYGRLFNSPLGRIYNVLTVITEPIVKPVRKLISRFINTGPVDIAPLITFFIVILVSRILTTILFGLARVI